MYEYDPAGNLTKKINAEDDTTSYEYDALNRLTAVVFLDTSQNIYYVYDDTVQDFGRGRLYEELAPACSTSYRYDAFGRLSVEYRTIDGVYDTTVYTYDKNGNIKTIRRPSKIVVDYTRNDADQVKKVRWWQGISEIQTLADSIEYLPFGGPTTWVLGNGISTAVSYDFRYLIDSLHTGADSTISRVYEYDSVGNVTRINDLLDTAKNQAFVYDDLNRLTSATSSAYPASPRKYMYSGNGNREELIIGTDTTIYIYSGNKLTGLTGADTATFAYDDLGNMVYDSTANGVRTFQYDDGGRMVSVDTGATADYEYDGRARRVKVTASGTTRLYAYDQFGRLITDRSYSGAWRADYVYLNGKPLAMITPHVDQTPRSLDVEPPPPPQPPDADVFYYHLDHLGTPQVLTNEDKVEWWRGDYLPFGKLYNEEIVVKNNLRFPGQHHDRETGLYYNWYRYYKPQLGRYVQADPIGLAGEVNLFSYANSSPISRWDPFGLKTYSCTETEKIIREAGQQSLWGAFWSHLGGHKYDYKVLQPNDTFNVGGNLLRADEFGNYLAGYSGYKSGGMFGYFGVRAGGVLYDFTDSFWADLLRATRRPYDDSRFDLDADSREQIDAGASRAILEEMGIVVNKCPCR
ncbi:MAG: RHS repeat-associated core domain-containing protein [Candidatus Zixiibacteriota bacterium]